MRFRPKLHSITLTRTRDPKGGRALAGLWESDVVRTEAVEGGWEFQCPMRRIGETHFYEFRPLAYGGQWRTVGILRTLDYCCIVAERLQGGTHVLRAAYRDELGPVPATVIEWAEVADEIASHKSVRPDA
jgi:hypothetical protein